eukprot:49249_1
MSAVNENDSESPTDHITQQTKRASTSGLSFRNILNKNPSGLFRKSPQTTDGRSSPSTSTNVLKAFLRRDSSTSTDTSQGDKRSPRISLFSNPASIPTSPEISENPESTLSDHMNGVKTQNTSVSVPADARPDECVSINTRELDDLRADLKKQTRMVSNLASEQDVQKEEHIRLMEQLSDISQQYADVKMSEEQAQKEYADAHAKMNEALDQRKAVQESFKELSVKYDEIRNGIVFSKVQANKHELDDVRDQNTKLIAELSEHSKIHTEMEGIIGKLRDELKSKSEQNQILLADLNERERTLSLNARAIQDEIEARESAADEKHMALCALERAATDCQVEVGALKKKHSEEIDFLRAESHASISHHERHSFELEAALNSVRRKTESLQKDNVRLQKNQKKVDAQAVQGLQNEIERMQQELDRKNRSLQDAMEALANMAPTTPVLPSRIRTQPCSPYSPGTQVYSPATPQSAPMRPSLIMSTPRTPDSTHSYSGHRRSSSLSSRLTPRLSLTETSDERSLKDKNTVLQRLANELSEAIQTKEEHLRSLRSTNTFLGKRVLELEKMLGIDHSDKDTFSVLVTSDNSDTKFNHQSDCQSEAKQSTDVQIRSLHPECATGDDSKSCIPPKSDIPKVAGSSHSREIDRDSSMPSPRTDELP